MLKNLISTIVFGLVLVVLYNELWKTPDVAIDRIHEIREQAVLQAKEGNYTEAILQLENLLKLAPDNELLRGDYLVVLVQSNQADLALTLAKEQDLLFIPEYALKELFEAALQTKDVNFAIVLAKQEIDRATQPVDIVINRATQLADNGYSTEADQLLSYLQTNDEDEIQNMAAARIILLSSSAPWLAQQQAQKILLEDGVERSQLWEIYGNYWVQQAREGNLQEAITQLNKVVDRSPPETNIRADLMVLLSWDAQYDKAEKVFDQLLSKQHRLPAYVRSAGALTLYNQGRLAESRDIYLQLISEQPSNPEYKKGLAKVYVELNQPLDALALLQPTSSIVDHDTLMIIGLAQQQAGRYEQALQSLSTAIQLNTKKDDAAYFAWADSLEKTAGTKDNDYVWPRYAVPLEQAPASVVTRVQKVLAGNSSKVARRSRNRNAFNLQKTRRQAAIARQQGRTDQAITLYQRGLARAANDRELQLGVALSYIDAGDESRSGSLLSKLREQYPHDREVLDGSIYHAQKFSQDTQLAKYLREIILRTEGSEQQQSIASWLALIERSDVYSTPQEKVAELNKLAHLNNHEIILAHASYYLAEQRCEQAQRAISSLSSQQLSRSQLESAAYIARSCQDAKQALELYQEGYQRYPDESVFVAGLILVLTDMQAYAEADKYASKYTSMFGHEVDFMLAIAYLRFNQQNFASSLSLYEQVLVQNPEQEEAYVGWVMSLAELGETEVAFQRAHEKPGLFTNAIWKNLYSLRSEHLLRSAEAAPVKLRVAQAEQSIAAIDEQLLFLQEHFPDDNLSHRNALLNQVRAYTLANQAQKSVATYESLTLKKEQVPVWGLTNAADAYLHARQPEQAIVLANQALLEDLDNLNLLAILFYAQLDIENYRAADVTRNMMQEIIHGKEVSQGRTHWVARLDALFEAYQNRLNIAEQKLDALQAKAPNDQQVAMNRATIYRWRGWPNKALETLDSIPEESVDSVALKSAKANALIDRQSFTQAEQVVSELVDQHFYHRDVKNIDERWRIHNLRQYTAEVLFGESTGNAFGNEELTFEQRLYTSPINNHFRAYARHRYEYAQFPEGNGYLNRVGLGGEYRSQAFDINAEVNGSTRDSTDPGITLSGVWRLDDHLSFSGEAQTFSRLVPLRGNNDDVEGKSVTLGARYRWNETHHARIAAGYADFDDGNQRKFFFIENQHGVYQSAHHQLSLSQEFYTSENDDIEAFYFNPERDYSTRVTAIYDGVIWRRYTRKWTHRLTFGVGNYKQRGESNAGIWDLTYLQHWQIDPTLEIKYGYIHRRRTYDGNPESFNAGIASLNWRF